MALALASLGSAYMAEGDLDAATAKLDESLAIGQELNDAWLLGLACANLGQIALLRGDMATATTRAEMAVRAGSEVGDRHLMAHGYGQLAILGLQQNSRERAEPAMNEVLRLFRELEGV